MCSGGLPIDEAGELLCAAGESGADGAEAQDDVQPVAHAAQKECIQVVHRVWHP